jgi:hypothetical protein
MLPQRREKDHEKEIEKRPDRSRYEPRKRTQWPIHPYPFLSSFMAAKTMMEDRGLLGRGDLNIKSLGVDLDFVAAAYAKLGKTIPEPTRREKVAGKVLA